MYYLLQEVFISVECICLSSDATSVLTFVLTEEIKTQFFQCNFNNGQFVQKYTILDIS